MHNQKTRIKKDPQKRELIVERFLDAPRQLVWEGWTKPECIAYWWGPEGWSTIVREMDVRPGGVWHYCLYPDDGEGQKSWSKAIYEVVDEPSLLVYVDNFSDEDGNIIDNTEMRTTVEFRDHGKGTLLSIRTVFNTADGLESAEAMGMVEGYAETLERLELYLASVIDKNKGAV